MLGPGDGRGEAPDVVAGEGRAHQIALVQNPAGQGFELGVGLPLLSEHRYWPPLIDGLDRFHIPVGALDQPDADGRAPPPDPVDHLIEHRRGIRQVGLQHKADMRPFPELRLLQHAAQGLQGQIAVLVSLHVDVDEGPQPTSLGQHRAEPDQQPLGRPRTRDRIEVRIEGAWLNREVDPWRASRTAFAEPRVVRPGLHGLRRPAQQSEAAGGVFICPGVAGGRLPEQIEGEAHPPRPQAVQGDPDLLRIATGDELPGLHFN